MAIDAAPTMRITVKLFGSEAVAAGQREIEVSLPFGRPTCEQLRCALVAQWPDLAPFASSMRFAVNYGYADDGEVIHAGDEIAIIGKVSGG